MRKGIVRTMERTMKIARSRTRCRLFEASEAHAPRVRSSEHLDRARAVNRRTSKRRRNGDETETKRDHARAAVARPHARRHAVRRDSTFELGHPTRARSLGFERSSPSWEPPCFRRERPASPRATARSGAPFIAPLPRSAAVHRRLDAPETLHATRCFSRRRARLRRRLRLRLRRAGAPSEHRARDGRRHGLHGHRLLRQRDPTPPRSIGLAANGHAVPRSSTTRRGVVRHVPPC